MTDIFSAKGLPGMPPFGPTLSLGGDPTATAISNPSLCPGVPGKKDPNVKVTLENEELWRQFDEVGTEMIITKTGR